MEDLRANDFYKLLLEYGQEVTFPDKGIKQHASVTPNRLNKAIATTDGAYWFTGDMTFDDMKQQEELAGEYFIPSTQPRVINILVNVFPNDFTEKVASIHCVECNDKIDIVSYYKEVGKDKYNVPILEPVYLVKDLPCYITSFTKDARNTIPGVMEETITYLTIPAKITLSTKNTIMKLSYVFDDETKTNILKKVPYQIESIDASMASIVDGKVVGTLKCMIKETQDKA